MRSTYFYIDKTFSALIFHLSFVTSSIRLLWFVFCIYSPLYLKFYWFRVLFCHVACLLRCGRRNLQNLQWAILDMLQSPAYSLLCTEPVHSCLSYSPIMTALAICWHVAFQSYISTRIARIMGPTWGHLVYPMLAPWTLLSGHRVPCCTVLCYRNTSGKHLHDIKHFTFASFGSICLHWDGAGCWNPSS